jgi:DNA-binding beta-propeller fold protein YncE
MRFPSRAAIGLALALGVLITGARLRGARAEEEQGERHPTNPSGAHPSGKATADEASPSAPHEPRRLPGAQAGGSILLPTQWSLRPAGDQIPLGDLPVNVALHPSGRWAAVLHAGYGDHEVVIVDLERKSIVVRAGVPYAFYGLAFDPAGRRLYASGGEDDLVHAFRFDKGYLSEPREIAAGTPGGKGVVAGLSVGLDGKSLYAASAWGDTVTILPLAPKAAVRRVSLPAGSFPYATLPAPDGRRFFVSLWGHAAVAVVDLPRGAIAATWKTESHPTEMVLSRDGARLFVACANSNKVVVLDARTGRGIETLWSALHPNAPNGSTPNSLALSPDGRALAVANADNNNVALFDVSRPGNGVSLGFIPAGWYPTCVRFSKKGDRLIIANGKGLIPHANRQGPNPLVPPPATVREYIAGLFKGSLSILASPSPAQMATLTKQAYACSPLRAGAAVSAPAAPPAGHPIPAAVGGASPIKHCLYIIKENRTYDQVLGDVREGNGDPGLCLFPDAVTPNHHALAREFVLLDNFYVDAEVSADGHEWSTAAYATDYDEKAWPLVYRESSKDKIPYPTGEDQPIVRPAGGYIWERCRAKGLTYRSYGEFVQPGKGPKDPSTSKMESLAGHYDPDYRAYDLDVSDVKRAERFLVELRRFESEGAMPSFIIMHLPNDHTNGSRAGKPTPTAYVADNDLALGMIVEGVSHSRFWKDTAIFVVEDDAQSGSDHVDAHRTVALVVSPWTKRGAVDSSLYSTTSMLRTMELILGLDPMSQFDAAALPMYASFQTTPDLTPYTHRPATVGFDRLNAKNAWGSALSETLDFSKPDAADDIILSEIVWRAVRGADVPMPPPVRAAFVFTRPGEDDGDEDDRDGDDRRAP